MKCPHCKNRVNYFSTIKVLQAVKCETCGCVSQQDKKSVFVVGIAAVILSKFLRSFLLHIHVPYDFAWIVSAAIALTAFFLLDYFFIPLKRYKPYGSI